MEETETHIRPQGDWGGNKSESIGKLLVGGILHS